MGAIFFSVDLELVRRLKSVLPLTAFVETGTFQGDTAELVAPLFASVRTIELSEQLHQRAVSRLRERANVTCLYGDSARVLRELKSSLAGQGVVYWLDAHWCGSATAGETRECPLLDELDAIAPLDEHDVVLIDDARLFLAPPPAPHDPNQWPSLEVVVERLRAGASQHRLSVVNDMMIFVPPAAHAAVVSYARSRGIDLRALVQQALRAAPAVPATAVHASE